MFIPTPAPSFLASCSLEIIPGGASQCNANTYSKWVHLRCSQLYLWKFRAHGSSHCWSCPPCFVPTRNTVTLSSNSSDVYISTVQFSFLSANTALPPHPRRQTSCSPSAHSVSFLSAPSLPSFDLDCPSTSSASFLFLTLQGSPMEC